MIIQWFVISPVGERSIAWRLLPWVIVAACAGGIPNSVWGQVRTAPDGNSLSEPVNAQNKPAEQFTELVPNVKTLAAHVDFASQINLTQFRKLAVFDGGRAKIIDTLARETLMRVYGKPRWKDPETDQKYDPVFTFLDLWLNKPYYSEKPIIYIEVLSLRRLFVRLLPQEQQDHWLRLGRFTPKLLASSHAAQLVLSLDADLRLQRAIQQLRGAVFAFDRVGSMLHVISPAPGTDKWTHIFNMG